MIYDLHPHGSSIGNQRAESRSAMPGSGVRCLMSLVLFSGLILGALRSPTPAWSFAVSEATFTLLLFSILAATLKPRRSRAYWIGFAVMGWGHLAFLNMPWFADSYVIPHRHVLEMVGGWAYPADFAQEFTEIGPKTSNMIIIIDRCLIICAAFVGGIISKKISEKHILENN